MIKDRSIKSGVIFLTFFVLLGCSSLPGPDKIKAEIASYQLPRLPEEGKAVIYVVRPSTFGKDFMFNVFIDDQEPKSEAGYTMGGQYIYFDLMPGEHKILSKADYCAQINVSAKAGDIIFILQSPSMGAVTFNNTLQILKDYEGKYYVKTLSMGTISKGGVPAQAPPQQSGKIQFSDLTGSIKGAQVNTISTAAQPVAPSFSQTETTLPANKTLIYIYRLPGKTGFAAFSGNDSPPPFGIKANGQTIVTLARGGYYAYLVDSGQIEFTTFEIGFMAPNSVSSITVDAKAQQKYYIKGAHGKGPMGRARLELVAPEVGANEITNCKTITQ